MATEVLDQRPVVIITLRASDKPRAFQTGDHIPRNHEVHDGGSCTRESSLRQSRRPFLSLVQRRRGIEPGTEIMCSPDGRMVQIDTLQDRCDMHINSTVVEPKILVCPWHPFLPLKCLGTSVPRPARNLEDSGDTSSGQGTPP